MRIGEQIKNYRKTAGLTQGQVADYLDVSTPATISLIKGDGKYISRYLITSSFGTTIEN